MNEFRKLLAGPTPVFAPLVINPLSAKLAEAAGARALYLGGGAMGYVKCVTEANLSLTEMVQAGIDVRTVCRLPLILDGACGWGDPMHQHRTINMTEAAGFSAIEIEDQLLPKRAHHHIGIEHLIPAELMVAKIKESVAARRDPDFVIIGRTNAARSAGLDEALRRGEAYRKAGSDILLVLPKKPDEVRAIGEKLGGPLMLMISSAPQGMTHAELHKLGYHLLVDASTPLLAAHRAMRETYAAIMRGDRPSSLRDEQDAIHEVIGLEGMLEIERRTVEK